MSSLQDDHQVMMKPARDEQDFLLAMELASGTILPMTIKSAIELDRSVQRLYGLAPVSKYFVPNEEGVSLAPTLLIIQDKVNMDSWSCVKDALLEGLVPFMKAHNGMDGFAVAAKDEKINNLFNQSMHNHTTIVMKEILETYKGFERLNQFVDVADGLGENKNILLTKISIISLNTIVT
ncbi:Flavone 3'-O-methyltransferase 1 [Citrus sinensis]|uniref:O-methyltransferase C-terminal domain-containing protein n=1 Tax=Citrus sinensis TaxID=2711 RepID=A0A067DBP5_CITSI|nr:Flavone 3'-O-methyltransferase 1 [Citrus sinensis]KDO40213.1 hypothetical protein CISIN_1g037090mg [Citrus sinensis]